MKKSTKWVLGFLVLFIVSAAGVGVFLMTQVAPIGTAYAAKRLCSCVFVSQREASSVLDEELGKYGYIGTSIDYDQKTVTASVLGLAKRTAVYRDGLGCTLTVGLGEVELRQQATGFDPSRSTRKDLPWPDGDLVKDAPFPASIDRAELDKTVEDAFVDADPAKLRRTRAVIVLHDGRIIAERYAPGFSMDTPQLGWSMTKSVMNVLVGILVMEGRLTIRDPAPVPEWRSAGDPRGAITLDHLLRMSSGLHFTEDYQDPFSDVVQMLFARPDAGAFAASLQLEAPPDSRWQYSSGSTNIISRIVRQTVEGAGSDPLSLPRRALFDRIGMSSAVMEPDPSGTFVGSSFMYATARDWARFGLLCSRDGVWNGRRILPEGWMKFSTTPTPGAPKGMYGAQFWLNAGDPQNPAERWKAEAPVDMYSMSGFEGQYVSIVPSSKLVIVRLGLSDPEDNWDHGRFIADLVHAVSGAGKNH
ncbi:MAG: beta-lactamase family protein [Desulfobacterota bacterium]|nr:beta-lactamase family protein [Thermodesulfobacteriota bacterium]